MKPVWIATVSGVLGFLAGALGYGWLAARQLDALHGVVQLQFATEQEYRAIRAERRGDLLAAWHHQQNAVEAQSDRWLHKVPAWETPRPWFALELALLKRIQGGMNPEGRQVVEGIARGHSTRAAAEWARAARLARSASAQEMRERIAYFRAQRQTSEVHQQVEAVILGPDWPSPGTKPAGSYDVQLVGKAVEGISQRSRPRRRRESAPARPVLQEVE